MLWTSLVYAGTEIPLREKIGQMLMVGFHGKRVTDPGVQRVAAQIKAGEVGGVILFAYNIGTLEETQSLVSCNYLALGANGDPKGASPLYIPHFLAFGE